MLLLAACGGDGGSAGTGTLSLSLGDSPGDYEAVYVTIEEISVHAASGGGWQVVATPDETYNLLELVNGVRKDLGLAELASGRYTQMRLKIGTNPDGGINILSRSHPYANYFIDKFDQAVELKIPSGTQTGLKIVNGFNIGTNQTTELFLDFSVEDSIVKGGSSGNWHLKPTVKVLNTAEYAIISGRVTDDEVLGLDNGIQGIRVSAQGYTPSPPADKKDEVTVEAATLTDAEGYFKLFVTPDTYNIVAVNISAVNGVHLPGCAVVTALSGINSSQDFSFSNTTLTTSGTVSGDVHIPGADNDTYATMSFRQSADCSGSSEVIEVKKLNVANAPSTSPDYDLLLPTSVDRAAAWTAGQSTTINSLLGWTDPPSDITFDAIWP